MTYKEIIDTISKKIYHPIYLLSGEETYYIDEIADYIAQHVLTEEEKSFNQSVFYGKESDVTTIGQMARRFPMMSNYQVIIIKEAQELQKLEELQHYAQNPLKSTILVICYKYKKYPKTSTLAKLIKKHGVVYEAETVWDNKVGDWIREFVKEKKYTIDVPTSELIGEHLGNSLHKLANELQKLMIILPPGSTITKEDVEKNIGISKEYNLKELTDAFAAKDALKVQRILQAFAANPKDNPSIVTISSLFTFFKNVLLFHFVPQKTNEAIAETLKIANNYYSIKKYQDAARSYSAQKLVVIISLIREFDLKLKGVNSGSASEHDLLRELAFKILH